MDNDDEKDFDMSLLDELETNLLRNILPILQPFRTILNNQFIRLNSNPIDIDPLVEYSEREYNEAQTIYLEMISGTYTRTDNIVHKHILNIMCTEYFKSGCESYPSIDQIIDTICSGICRCHTLVSPIEYRQIIKLYATTEAFVPSCFEFEHILLYHAQMGTYPTVDECYQFIENCALFSNDPLEYYQKDKTHVPTLNVDKLPIIKGNDDTVCALCQEVCSSSQDCIQLKPCNHMFHSIDKDCLETTSIHYYLSQNNVCPLCKSRINS